MGVSIRDVLILTAIPGIGPARLRALLSRFGNCASVAQATPRELGAVEGIDRRSAASIAGFFRSSSATSAEHDADDQIARMRRCGGRVITLWDAEYPSNLKRIYDPPPFLFLRGSFDASDAVSIAIVGTRSPDAYGVQMAERFASDLAALGLPVVSGLARGIDTVAHTATLRAQGRTLAVIGSGIDIIYPPENRALAGRIAAAGAVVSEFEMGTKPDACNFPRRNRIISGIAIATVVVQTGIDGGAMITASTAFDQDREVFAIPSAVSTKARSGTNLLVRQGQAILTESVDQIVEEMAPKLRGVLGQRAGGQRPPPPDLNLFEQRILDAIGEGPVHIDALAERAGLSAPDTLVHLLSMEFKGVVRQMPGKTFVRV